MVVKIALLIVFFGIMVGVGIRCRRHTTSVGDFVLGGRGVGPWLSAFAYGTSYFSAVIFVGYAGQFGWKYGLASTWIGIGNALIGSLLAWVILGRRTRIMTHHLKSATMPDFFEKRYGSKALKIVASIIIFIFMIPYTASLYNGLSRIFGMAFNIDYTVCIILMAVLTGVYVVAGGYMATAINDFIQGIIMLGGIVAVITSVLAGQGGFLAAVRSLAEVSDSTVSTVPGIFSSFFGPDPAGLLGVVILTSLGTWGLPQMLHKFYAIKSEKAISTGTVISTLFALVIAGGSYYLGGFGRLFSGDAAIYNKASSVMYDAIVPRMLAGLPDILIGIVVVLVLSASMSTLSSLVLTSSSTLTLDFISGNLVKEMSEKRKVLIMRIFIVIFIAISGVIAVVQYKSAVAFIAQLMGISWGAVAGAFLAPFMYGLYWRGVTRAGVWASYVFGVGLTVSNMVAGIFGKAFIASPINAGAIAMIGGLVLVPLVSLVTKRPDKTLVDDAFKCYGSVVAAEAKYVLPKEEEETC